MYAGSSKLIGFIRDRKPEILINYYKYQCNEDMIRNGMLNIFYLPDPHNTEKKWDLLLHQSRFPLDFLKRHV